MAPPVANKRNKYQTTPSDNATPPDDLNKRFAWHRHHKLQELKRRIKKEVSKPRIAADSTEIISGRTQPA